jgi:hypothetical protein
MFIALPALHGFAMSLLIERFRSFAERPRRLIFTLLLLVPFVVSPATVVLCVVMGLGWALSRKVGVRQVWTSPSMVWVGRTALLLTAGFALVNLAGDVAEIL